MKTIPLSQTTKFIVDNRGRTAPTAPTGIALIATNCVSNDRLYPSYESLRYVSQETYETWFRAHPEPGDILLTNKGSQNGAVSLVPDPVDFVIAQDMVALRANEEIIDPLFLFAALRSPDVQRQIKNLDVSGIIPHFKKTDFDKLHLPYPDQHTQKEIGQLYFVLSAKIELNRRMNETLEALAQTLFKSWFVDAVADGLPKGWREGKVSDLALISRGGINPSEFPNELFDHYSIPAFDEGQSPKPELGSTIKSNKFIVPSECVMISKLNPRIPRIWLPDLSGKNRAVCSTEFLVILPEEIASREYLYCLFKDESFISVFATMVTGTSGSHQRVKPASLLSMDIALPAEEVIHRFKKQVTPVLKRISQNISQSRTLAELRDTLLPKLLSGELRV